MILEQEEKQKLISQGMSVIAAKTIKPAITDLFVKILNAWSSEVMDNSSPERIRIEIENNQLQLIDKPEAEIIEILASTRVSLGAIMKSSIELSSIVAVESDFEKIIEAVVEHVKVLTDIFNIKLEAKDAGAVQAHDIELSYPSDDDKAEAEEEKGNEPQ